MNVSNMQEHTMGIYGGLVQFVTWTESNCVKGEQYWYKQMSVLQQSGLFNTYK